MESRTYFAGHGAAVRDQSEGPQAAHAGYALGRRFQRLPQRAGAACARAVFACCLVGSAVAENLLVNSGFDAVDVEGKPEHWDLFVMPMEGAHGELDSSTMGPPFSVKLHNPQVYPEEPVNNWSQSIIGDYAGQTLRVAGTIRTDDATEAAIWLQCWSRNPPRVLAAYSTSTDAPIYGTHDWTPVSMRVDVPERTDFLVLRCVLKGRGTAWFDVLSVEPAAADLPQASETATGREADTLRELLEANASLSATLSAMTETNKSLLDQIMALQEEVRALREDVGENAAHVSAVTPPAQSPPSRTEVTVNVPGQPERDPRIPRGQTPQTTAEPGRQYGPHPLVPLDWPEEDPPR